MKKEYNLAKMKGKKNPYASKNKKSAAGSIFDSWLNEQGEEFKAEVIARAMNSNKTVNKKRMSDGLKRGLKEAITYKLGKKSLKATLVTKKKSKHK